MDALEKLKDIISDDIYNEIEEAFEEKDSRISELESEKEDLEYEVSNLESEISNVRNEKDEFESELFELNQKLSYYIDDYIEENFPTFQLILKSEYNELKEEHEKYREGWFNWEKHGEEYEYLKEKSKWDNISHLTITNTPSDMNQMRDGTFVSYWIRHRRWTGATSSARHAGDVYRSTRSDRCGAAEALHGVFQQGDPEFKMIGILSVRRNPRTRRSIKRIVYFSTLKKNMLNKYFNLLKKNKSTKL